MEEMTQHHDNANNAMQQDVIDACFEYYGEYLDELEKKDIRQLKKRLGELKGMQKNLTRELQEQDQEKMNLLREREQILLSNNNPMTKRSDDKLRLKCQAKFEEIDQAKEWVLADQEK